MRPREVLAFAEAGHTMLPGFLGAREVLAMQRAVRAAMGGRELEAKRHTLRLGLGMDWAAAAALTREEVERHFGERLQNGRSEASFLQYFNLWRESAALRDAALHSGMGAAAAALLGVRRVRLYSDALFVKRPGDGVTDWHTDMEHVPLGTDAFLTFWVPLQPVPALEEGGSPLVFLDRSPLPEGHRGDERVWSHGRLSLGDVTVHHGKTLHAAPELGRGLAQERWALAISYFADGAERVALEHGEDDDEERESFEAWVDEVPLGLPARHALLPEVPTSGRATLPGPRQPGGSASAFVAAAMSPLQARSERHYALRLAKLRAMLLQEQDRLEEATQLWTEVLRGLRVHLGPRDPDTLDAARNLARVLRERGRLGEAEALFRGTTQACREELGDRHHMTLLSIAGLAALLQGRGCYDEAEALHREALLGFQAELGEHHPATLQAEEDLRELAALRRTRGPR